MYYFHLESMIKCYVIPNKLKIKLEFKKENGELISSPEELFGKYKLKDDSLIKVKNNYEDKFDCVEIESDYWGNLVFKFLRGGMILCLPNSNFLNYSYTTSSSLKSIIEEQEITARELTMPSFSFDSINNFGDELVKELLGRTDTIIDGYVYKYNITEEDRNSLTKEVSIVKILKEIKKRALGVGFEPTRADAQ